MKIGLIAGMPDMSLPMGSSTIELLGSKISVDVVFDYQPATPDNEEGPGDGAQVRLDSILLRSGLALHDTNNVMTLVISAGTDVLAMLPERALLQIAEQVLAKVERGE